MNSEENSSGKPLANSSWLLNHHRAKIPERTAFAKRLAKLQPKKIVDLGCATGLWLELLNEILPQDCEFMRKYAKIYINNLVPEGDGAHGNK